jgi:hypothetical protein
VVINVGQLFEKHHNFNGEKFGQISFMRRGQKTDFFLETK